jgi:2-dehydropantoate 2-reductase
MGGGQVSRVPDGTRVAVVGTGANGGAIAADLTRAGVDTTLIEQWPEHVEAMRRDGLTVSGPTGSITTPVVAYHLADVARLRTLFDVVVLGVKAYDTRWALELIRPLTGPDTVFVGTQNGMTVDVMTEVVGSERVIGSVIEVAANIFTPAQIQQEVPMWFAVGAPDRAAARHVDLVAAVLECAGVVEVTDDILSAKWTKVVANASELVTSAILDLPLAEAIRLPGMYDVMAEAGREAGRTAVALGHSLVPIFGAAGDATDPDAFAVGLLDKVLETYSTAGTLTTVLQDWRKGRRAEAEDINGLVVRSQESLGGDAPMNRRVVELARRIEAGDLEPSPVNTGLMLEVLG